MRQRFDVFVATLSVLLVSAHSVEAQAGYEIEVYGAEMAIPKTLLLELHSNYTFQGQQLSQGAGQPPIVDDNLRRLFPSADPTCAGGGPTLFELSPSTAPAASFAVRAAPTGAPGLSAAAAGCSSGALAASGSNTTHETLEAATGLTSWSEVGAYIFGSKQGSGPAQLVGESFRIRARIPIAWRWPLDVGLSTEFEHDNPAYSADVWTWEIRPIIDKTMGRWYASANPTLERTLQGAGVANGLQFSPSGKLSYDFTKEISGGVEYYGAFGQIGAFAPPVDRLQQFFGTVDLRTSAVWEINFGIGLGTTPATEHLMAKLILGRTLSW